VLGIGAGGAGRGGFGSLLFRGLRRTGAGGPEFVNGVHDKFLDNLPAAADLLHRGHAHGNTGIGVNGLIGGGTINAVGLVGAGTVPALGLQDGQKIIFIFQEVFLKQ